MKSSYQNWKIKGTLSAEGMAVENLTEFCVAWLLEVYTRSCWNQLFQEEEGFVGNIVLERW